MSEIYTSWVIQIHIWYTEISSWSCQTNPKEVDMSDRWVCINMDRMLTNQLRISGILFGLGVQSMFQMPVEDLIQMQNFRLKSHFYVSFAHLAPASEIKHTGRYVTYQFLRISFPLATFGYGTFTRGRNIQQDGNSSRSLRLC